jgi:hypothetical protein
MKIVRVSLRLLDTPLPSPLRCGRRIVGMPRGVPRRALPPFPLRRLHISLKITFKIGKNLIFIAYYQVIITYSPVIFDYNPVITAYHRNTHKKERG